MSMQKVLIANRGEIAVRIIRACHDMGLQTVAVYSQADAESLHVLHADEAVCIGEAPSRSSYLKVPNILSACEITGADAIHPGYGFLSENANFASICESCGIQFIGPSHQAIAKLGDKSAAKAVARSVHCPVIPGSDGIVDDVQVGLQDARRLGYPIFIKAVAGGGGKGIRIAYNEEEFPRQFTAARTEAQVSFGVPSLYLEKMIVNPRHIEIQVFGDTHGSYVYIGERDCTIQRRRQKLIEESPSSKLDAKLREEIGQAAVRIVKAAQYSSAGTVEFLLDQENHYYFMEVNTRIQVEHTVTEMLYDVDLVREQLRIAKGEPLSWKQSTLVPRGHVFQFRINAENSADRFATCPGRLEYYVPPGGPNVRVDSACYSGYVIPPHYDSMIAKLLVRGQDRTDAIAIAKRALQEFHLGGAGIHSTIPFHLYMLNHPRFISGEYTIGYIDELIEQGCTFTENAAHHAV